MLLGKFDNFKDSLVRIMVSRLNKEPMMFLPTDNQQYNEKYRYNERYCKDIDSYD